MSATVTGGIYSIESDAPGSLLASFGSATVTSFSFEQRSLTTGGLFTLQANTSYAILLEQVAGSETANWGRPTDANNRFVPTFTNASAGSAIGYRYNGSSGTWGSSSHFNAIRLNSPAAVPEPGSAFALSACLGGLLLRRRRRTA